MDKKPIGWQIPAIAPFAPIIQESFDLNRMDLFVKSLGSEFWHWKSSPSPIGLNSKGDYRRNETDVITSNGYVYNFGGRFTATMTGNQKDQKRPSEGGLLDSSTAYLVMPRFYDDASDNPVSAVIDSPFSNKPCPELPLQVGPIGDECCNETITPGKRIRLAVGDRLYHDPSVDSLVINKELMNFSFDGPNIAMYPIVQMDAPIVDSNGCYYSEGQSFTLCNGNIVWTPGQPNPGIDPATGEGRTYSIRYLYHAFYYVVSLLREVRITETTKDGYRSPERMPMYVMLQREFLYHNINNSNPLNKPPTKAQENRQTVGIPDSIDIKTGKIKVEQTDYDNDT
jgi:hypothetical protein